MQSCNMDILVKEQLLLLALTEPLAFLPATQSIIFANNVQLISTERTHMIQKAFVLGLRNIVIFERITILSPATSTILTKLGFVLALAEISGLLHMILPNRLILEVLQIMNLLSL